MERQQRGRRGSYHWWLAASLVYCVLSGGAVVYGVGQLVGLW